MAAIMTLGKLVCPISTYIPAVALRGIQTSAVLQKHIRAGRFKPTKMRTTMLTYEEAKAPHLLGVDKSWNSWNSSNLEGEGRQSETVIEDTFIRRFITGTWYKMFHGEVVIKRRHNMIILGGFISMKESQKSVYFLTGYTEELLSCLLKCPVKLEIQTIAHPDHLIFKRI